MKYDEFLAKVRERGGYADRQEAERVAHTVLGVLAQRLEPGAARDLAARLPVQAAGDFIGRTGPASAFGVREFLKRIAEPTGGTTTTAEWDASAVLSAVAEGVGGGELRDVLTQLPSGYATLFGEQTLSG